MKAKSWLMMANLILSMVVIKTSFFGVNTRRLYRYFVWTDQMSRKTYFLMKNELIYLISFLMGSFFVMIGCWKRDIIIFFWKITSWCLENHMNRKCSVSTGFKKIWESLSKNSEVLIFSKILKIVEFKKFKIQKKIENLTLGDIFSRDELLLKKVSAKISIRFSMRCRIKRNRGKRNVNLG